MRIVQVRSSPPTVHSLSSAAVASISVDNKSGRSEYKSTLAHA